MTETTLEFQTMVVPLDENYQEKLAEMAAQGWTVIEGTVPFAVFNLCRPLNQQPALRAKVEIDEAGVSIIRGNSG